MCDRPKLPSDHCPNFGGTQIKIWQAMGGQPRARCVECKYTWSLYVPGIAAREKKPA